MPLFIFTVVYYLDTCYRPFFSGFLVCEPLKAVNGHCLLSVHIASHAVLWFQFLIWLYSLKSIRDRNGTIK